MRLTEGLYRTYTLGDMPCVCHIYFLRMILLFFQGTRQQAQVIQSMLAQGLWTEERADNFIDGGAPYYRCYRCSDGKYLSVGCIEPKFFAEFLQLVELDPDLAKRQNDKAFWPQMHLLFEETIAAKSRDEWASKFEGSDACVAPVLDFSEAQAYPHHVARQTFQSGEEVWQTAPAPRFSRSIPMAPEPATSGGDGASEILKNAGYNETDIEHLAKIGVIL